MDKFGIEKSVLHSLQSGLAGLRLRRILVPVDFDGSMVAVLQYAMVLAKRMNAGVTLLHVVKPVQTDPRHGSAPSVPEQEETSERQLRKLVDVIWGNDVRSDIVVTTGKPHVQIVNEAREINADLIVMTGREPVQRWRLFRASTTVKIVHHAPCPVLIVPPFSNGSAVDCVTEKGFDQ